MGRLRDWFRIGRRPRASGDPRQWRTDGGLDAGRVDRRDPDFMPMGYGPNTLVDRSNLARIKARVRSLIDNNEYIDGALETHTDNIVGLGITCEADTGFDDLNEQLDDLFEWASRRVDPDRSMTLPESQRLFYRELFVGECLVHHVVAEAHRGWPTMPAIELIDGERLDHTLEKQVDGGGYIRQAVEFDNKGRTVAYHVMTEHPGDASLVSSPMVGGAATERYPVEDAELCHLTRRVAQIRGLPQTLSVIGTIRMEDGLCEDTMLAARVAAQLGAFFEMSGDTQLFHQGDGTDALAVDAMGKPIQRIEPGSVGFVRPGSKLHLVAPNQPGPQFETAVSVLLRRISRALRVPFDVLTGDYSKTNYSSSRAAGLDARKSWQPRQRFVWNHHTEPWRRRLIDWAVFMGRVKLTNEHRAKLKSNPELLYRSEPLFPGWRYVNPAQESVAAGEDLDNGVRSHIEVIADRGGSWRRVIRQQAKWERELEKAGIGGGGSGKTRADRTDVAQRDAQATKEDQPAQTRGQRRATRMAVVAAAETQEAGDHVSKTNGELTNA